MKRTITNFLFEKLGKEMFTYFKKEKLTYDFSKRVYCVNFSELADQEYKMKVISMLESEFKRTFISN